MYSRIKNLREENNISQEELAKIIGMSRGSYGHYELEDDILPVKYLNELCNYFNCSLDYIFDFVPFKVYKNFNNGDIDISVMASRIKEFRKDFKITQINLANFLNTSQSTIADYEKGKRLISTSYLYAICKKYNISADYLLGKIDEPKYLK